MYTPYKQVRKNVDVWLSMALLTAKLKLYLNLNSTKVKYKRDLILRKGYSYPKSYTQVLLIRVVKQ